MHSSLGLDRIERTDHNVVPVRITECKLLGSSVRVQVRLLFESDDESAGPRERLVKIIHTKEQKQSIAGGRVVGTRQRWVLVVAPVVET